MLFKLKMIALVCLLLSGCVPSQDSTTQSVGLVKGYNVFGHNDKELVASSERQFNLVGRLIVPDGTYCTASLVWKNLIITAAHCVFKEGEFLKGKYQFLLGASSDTSVAESGVSYVWWGTSDSQNNRNLDWAILKIEKPLGVNYGYFGWKASTEENLENIMQAGYGNLFYQGKSMTGVQECSGRAFFPERGLIFHDCDSSTGDSGSPLFQCDDTKTCYIVALHVAEYRDGGKTSLVLDEYSDKNANIAIYTESFAAKLRELRAANP
jgi:protease YdgD